MELFKRAVNQALNLKHKLDDGAGGKFVRAFLTDKTGAALIPPSVNLSHIGSGVYSENVLLMPNLDQVVVSYAVFTDNSYTTKDASYSEDADVYEKDNFDPTNFLPKGQNITVQFSNQKLNAVVGSGEITAKSDKVSIGANVVKPEVQVEFKTNNEIEGVIND